MLFPGLYTHTHTSAYQAPMSISCSIATVALVATVEVWQSHACLVQTHLKPVIWDQEMIWGLESALFWLASGKRFRWEVHWLLKPEGGLVLDKKQIVKWNGLETTPTSRQHWLCGGSDLLLSVCVTGLTKPMNTNHTSKSRSEFYRLSQSLIQNLDNCVQGVHSVDLWRGAGSSSLFSAVALNCIKRQMKLH